MTDYKATSDQWVQVQKCADVVGSADCSAILELRARVEALEANSKPTPKDRQIRSSLVDRVAIAIDHLPTKDWNKETWDDEARAAIREVALWLNKAPLDLYPGDRSIVVNALYDQANQ
jgi:hypothetical protein